MTMTSQRKFSLRLSWNFAGYVKEVDEDLFERAKDYARSFTELEGYDISFIDSEKDEEED